MLIKLVQHASPFRGITRLIDSLTAGDTDISCVQDSLENVMATAVNDASAKCKVSTLMRLLLEWAQQVVFDRMHERVGMDTVDMDSITWVITVPAIWSPGAKAFMRQAAYVWLYTLM